MGVAQQITDHAGEALAQRLQIFKGKPNLAALLNIANAHTQELEGIFWQLQSFVLRNVNDATGDLLTLFGKIVGEPRGNSVGDSDYRLRIRARIKANRSVGLPEQIYGVFRALLGPTAVATLEYRGGGAEFELELSNYSLAESLVDLFTGFMFDAKQAGVYGVLWQYEGNESEALRFGTTASVSSAVLAGVTTLPAVTTAGFPAAGSLLIDEGLATEETRAYTGITATSFTGVTATGQAHAVGADMELVGSPGLGLGDHDDPSYGGYAAGWTGA